MATFVHARRRDGQILFRVWQTCVDRYETEPLSRETALAYLLEGALDNPVRQRADAALGVVKGLLEGTNMRVHALRESHSTQEAAARLDRAARNGTSSMMGDKDDLDGPWDTEMCHCGAFHHAFQLRSRDQLCGWCGESESDRGHRPACPARSP